MISEKDLKKLEESIWLIVDHYQANTEYKFPSHKEVLDLYFKLLEEGSLTEEEEHHLFELVELEEVKAILSESM